MGSYTIVQTTFVLERHTCSKISEVPVHVAGRDRKWNMQCRGHIAYCHSKNYNCSRGTNAPSSCGHGTRLTMNVLCIYIDD